MFDLLQLIVHWRRLKRVPYMHRRAVGGCDQERAPTNWRGCEGNLPRFHNCGIGYYYYKSTHGKGVGTTETKVKQNSFETVTPSLDGSFSLLNCARFNFR